MSKANPYPEQLHNFLGIDEISFDKADVVVLPISYDSTTSYIGGTKHGPQAIINASRHVELYDSEIDCDVSEKIKIFTEPGIEPDKNSPEKTLARISEVVKNLLNEKKFVVSLGGEHSITVGIVKSFAEKFNDLTVLQFDAHTDLRDEWQSTRFSHACALRRCRDFVKNTVHVGIRNPGPEELNYIKENKIPIFFAHKIHDSKIDEIVKQILNSCTKNIYITFDVDCFDTSIMPTTGTPVPGGLNWQQATKLLKEVIKQKNLVGFDIVELIPGNHATEFLAANLAYKILGYKFS